MRRDGEGGRAAVPVESSILCMLSTLQDRRPRPIPRSYFNPSSLESTRDVFERRGASLVTCLLTRDVHARCCGEGGSSRRRVTARDKATCDFKGSLVPSLYLPPPPPPPPPPPLPPPPSSALPSPWSLQHTVTAAAVLVARSVELAPAPALKRKDSVVEPLGIPSEASTSFVADKRPPIKIRGIARDEATDPPSDVSMTFLVGMRPPVKIRRVARGGAADPPVVEPPSDVSIPFLGGTRSPIKIRRIPRGEGTDRRLNVDGSSQGIGLSAPPSRYVKSPTVKTEGVSKVEEVPLGVRSFELNTSTISQSQEYSQQCMKPHAANIGDFEGREPVASGIGTVGFARRLKFGTPNVGYKATWAALGPPHELQHPTIEQLVSSIPVPLAFTTDVVVSHELHRQTVSHQLSLLETGLLEMSGICQQILEICKLGKLAKVDASRVVSQISDLSPRLTHSGADHERPTADPFKRAKWLCSIADISIYEPSRGATSTNIGLF
ncbi:hypothetical protein BV25DRAFT_1843112 [Artomyces pyxidatus]|uniref:Uncharacterized protein n=1 Tax=Artomyces pyxidatus TaxID=48021 RepID=A0ACB8SG53_9AGAM|nr:hypothetical protein BV25DRAFT_1843112 [Artomyces pyxidatus]